MRDIIDKLSKWLKPNKQYNIVEAKNSFVIKVVKEADVKSIWTKEQQEYLDNKFNTIIEILARNGMK